MWLCSHFGYFLAAGANVYPMVTSILLVGPGFAGHMPVGDIRAGIACPHISVFPNVETGLVSGKQSEAGSRSGRTIQTSIASGTPNM